jgi:hypothetical protein
MSALPPKADIRQRNWDVRFAPKAGIHQRELHVQGTISGPKSAEQCSSGLFVVILRRPFI